MGIIDYKQLEDPIKCIEDVLKHYDNEEKALILKIINQRFLAQNKKRVMNEAVSNMDIGTLKTLTKKFLRRGEDE